jgi:MoxR-like ATPase
LDNKVKEYILELVNKTRNKNFNHGEYITLGCSPRASIALFIAAKAEALIKGRNYVIPNDVKSVAHDVLRHRIMLSYKAKAENINVDKVVDELLKSVVAP